jgi:sugar lactone lactonase YvrE
MKRLQSFLWLAVAVVIAAGVGCDSASLTESEYGDVVAKKPAGTPGMAGLKLAAGEASIVYAFPDEGMVQIPEGIAFDRQGNMYLSNRLYAESGLADNRIEKIAPDGQHSVLAHLGPTGCPQASGILGLTTDPVGNVYAAFGACNSNNGVVRVSRNGTIEHLAGSESMVFPNSLTFDSKGNLYVTDSFGGTVYRYGKSGVFELWLADDLLAPDFSTVIPHGANGIAYHAPNHLYVANSRGGWIVHIPIMPDGRPGNPQKIVATGPLFYMLIYPDGITVDAHGMIYAAIGPAGTPPPPGVPGPFPPFSPVVKVDPSTGLVTPMLSAIEPGGPGSELFDTPTSLAFGTGPRDQKSVFLISGDMMATPTGSGPAVTQVGVGAPGATGGQ